jgi:multiple sugar transport system ATP-binding protein
VFLLDEPMSALDERIRIKLRTELKELQRELATTTVYVTHNQEQAMALSDEIIILNDGEIEQQGTPDEIFDEPANVFVAEFIGSPRINLFEATLEDTTLTVDGTDVRLELPGASAHPADDASREVYLGIRPSRIELSPESTGNNLRGTVGLLEKLGQEDVVFLDCPAIGGDVRVETDRTDIKEGTTYDLSFDPADVHLFDRTTGEALRLNKPAKPAQ